MTDTKDTSGEGQIDPEAQKTADLISKLMTTLTESGKAPDDEERIRRLEEEEQRINTSLKTNPGTTAEDNALFNRMISIANVKSGIEKSLRAAKRAAAAELAQDRSNMPEFLARDKAAVQAHRAGRKLQPAVYRGRAKPPAGAYQPPPESPGTPTTK